MGTIIIITGIIMFAAGVYAGHLSSFYEISKALWRGNKDETKT